MYVVTLNEGKAEDWVNFRVYNGTAPYCIEMQSSIISCHIEAIKLLIP